MKHYKKFSAVLLVICIMFGACACGNKSYIIEKQISSDCDVILCAGYDNSNNYYELVGNQSETSQGYNIELGIIKNNQWLVELTNSFPFLGSDGLFQVSSNKDDLFSSTVRNAIRFISTGGFMIENYVEPSSWFSSSSKSYILYSCQTQKTLTLDCKEYTVLFPYNTISDDILSDNGKVIVYRETTGTISGWLKDQVFDWFVLDTSSLDLKLIGSGINGIRPESVLSEGLVYASDGGFYDTNMTKVIDLSSYDIDLWDDDNDMYFENGKCTFVVENQLGTEFEITIDKNGSVISEKQR